MSVHAGGGGGGDLRASSPAPLPPLPPLALAAAADPLAPPPIPLSSRSPLAEGAAAAARPASPLLLPLQSSPEQLQRRRALQEQQEQQEQDQQERQRQQQRDRELQQQRRRLEQRRALQGPTPWSNWVIPGRLLAGGFPASPDDADTRHTLLRLMGSPGTGGCGVTAFCCLQSELDPKAPPAAWRRGAALRPYPRDAAALLAEAAADGWASGAAGQGKVLELPTLGPAAVVSCYGEGPPMMAMAAGGSFGGNGNGSGNGNGGNNTTTTIRPPSCPLSALRPLHQQQQQQQPLLLDPFTATADMMGPGGSAAAAAAAAGGRPPVPCDSPSASPRPGDPHCRVLLAPERRVDFLHLPIPDGGTAPDAALSALADDVAARVRAGQVVYAHCWGGHGRTGSLVAVVLARLYGLPAEAALRATQACHDARVFPQGTRSPQTQAQRQQVVRVVAAGGAAGGGGWAGGSAASAAAASAASAAAAATALLMLPHSSRPHLPPLLSSHERERVGGGGGGGKGALASQQHQQQQQEQQQQQQHRAASTQAAAASEHDRAADPVGAMLRKRSRPAAATDKIPADSAA